MRSRTPHTPPPLPRKIGHGMGIAPLLVAHAWHRYSEDPTLRLVLLLPTFPQSRPSANGLRLPCRCLRRCSTRRRMWRPSPSRRRSPS